ncbi:sigma-54-dependent Fis family transcriptional regulator [candidate division KSB1 bacterium]|nr:sigma-54-dependent Fis family transcriptional regulator [candidate division KSB1 bacterium]
MVHSVPKVLIAEDDEAFANQLCETLKSENYDVFIAHDGSEALSILRNNHIDLGFIDLSMPGIDGLQVLEQAQTVAPDVPLIMITGFASIERAVQATRLGAYDFIEKPASLDRLLLTAQHALEKRQLQLKNRWMAEEIMSHYKMIGTSEAMQHIYNLIDKIAPTESTVLITGETGTGKELVARALHIRSLRSNGPFVHVNCAAIPDTLLESELFGFRKGAFTNAMQDKKGKIEVANGGSILLDEIGDLSISSQAKILRILESHEIAPIGGTEDKKVDVRFFTATNKNISGLIEQGNFREDLYYRMNSIEIQLPPLRERIEDIPELIAYFLEIFCKQNNRFIQGFEPNAVHLLTQQDWPGNVRQLRSVIERLVILSSRKKITANEVLLVLETQNFNKMNGYVSFHEAERAFQKEFFTNALVAHGWNVSETANSLKIDRTNLYKKMQRLGIKRRSDL